MYIGIQSITKYETSGLGMLAIIHPDEMFICILNGHTSATRDRANIEICPNRICMYFILLTTV